MVDFVETLKSIIEKILFCSGEPFSVLSEPVDLLYGYVRKVSRNINKELDGKQPTLVNLLTVYQSSSVHIERITKYFFVLSEIQTSNCCFNDLSNDGLSDQSDILNKNELINNENRTSSKDKFTFLCKRLKIAPSDLFDNRISSDSKLSVLLDEINQGRRLRLKRIDSKYSISGCSIDDFMKFNQMRQSASFFNLIRNGRPDQCKRFIRWYFELNDDDNNDLVCLTKEDLNLLAYLLTGDVLNIIDLALFNRLRLKIDIQSPLTPIEINQSIKKLDKVLPFNLKKS